MKKIYLIALTVMAVMMAMTSCDEAEYVAPKNISIKLEPNPCAPGDTVTATLVYGVAGDNWYWYKTTSSFSVPTKFVPIKVGYDKVSQYHGSCNEPSFCKFLAPETPGIYNVSYHGQISITAGSSIWGDQVDCNARLTVE